jgi:membrane protease YdiL (CAAX protease family)
VGAPHLGVHGPSGLTPPSSTGRRLLVEEILVVLSLSLVASAVFAIIDLLSAPVAGIAVAVYPNVDLATQVASIAFGLAPAALVVHLARRSGEGLRPFGLAGDTLLADAGWGLLLGLGVAAAGIGIYLGSVALKVNRFVVPVPPLHHWWTYPVLFMGSAQAALLEEVIVVGYLIRRFLQLGWPAVAAVVASGLLRGSYHLYQGWGGFTGNLALGLAFGFVFLRWRRTWPLVVAHFSVDVLAGVGYILFRGHCPFGVCIR